MKMFADITPNGFGYWNPKTNNWSTLLEFDKSKHNIQWSKIT